MIDKCIIDPEKDCLGLAEAAILKKRIDDLEEWRNKSSKFHEDFYDWQRTQIARDAKLDEQLKNMDNNIHNCFLCFCARCHLFFTHYMNPSSSL